MVSSCLVVMCPNRGHISGVTYHKLGKKRYSAWLNSIGRSSEDNLSKDNVICSKHFEKSCFELLKGRTVLKKNAIPTLFLRKNQNIERIIEDNEREPPPEKAGISSSSDCERGSDIETGYNSSDSASLRESTEKNRKLIEKIHTYATTPEKTKKQAQKTNQINGISTTIEKTKKQVQTNQINGIRYIYHKYKINHLQQVVTILKNKNMISTDAESVLQQSFAYVRQIDMKRMLLNVKSNRVTPHPVLRSFAMTLHLYSDRAYEYVRRTFNMALPSRRDIRKWFSNEHCEPGFSEPAFVSLKMKVDENRSKGYSTFCSLMLDDMIIKKDIDFQDGKSWGHVDLGTAIDSDCMEYASHALVLMVVAVNGTWKLPIAYFLIRSLKDDEKANIVREALIKLKDTGVTIISLTCDGPTVNFSMMNALGTNLNLRNLQPYFLHPSNHGSKIYCVFDAYHLMNMIYINWAMLVKFYDDEGEIVDFNYIKLLYSITEARGAQLAKKLKPIHLDWSKKEMKENLPVQILSETVASALEYLMMDVKDPRFKAAGATIRFVKLMSKVFDLLNSRNPLTVKMKMPIKEDNENLWSPVFEEAIKLCKAAQKLDNKKIIHSENKSSFRGMIITLNSIIGMYNDFVKTKRLQYLLTCKFSQDYLELFFSSVRTKNRYNYNPSAVQFFHSYRKRLLHYEIKNMISNFTVQDNSNLSLNDVHIIRKHDIQIVKNTIYDYEYAMPIKIPLTDLIQNVVPYIAGYAIKMTDRIIKCPTCIKSLSKLGNSSKKHCLIRKKWLNLIVPSKDVIQVCKEVEINFRQTLNEPIFFNSFINQIYSKLLMKPNLFKNIQNHSLQNLILNENHIKNLIKTLAACYYKIRLYNLAKTQNCQAKRLLVPSKFVLFNHEY